MLHGYVFVLHPCGALLGGDQKAGEAHRDHYLSGLDTRAGDLAPAGQIIFHFFCDSLGRCSHLYKKTRDQSFILSQESKQQVLTVNLRMSHGDGDILCI